MSAKKKKSEEAQRAAPEKAPAAVVADKSLKAAAPVPVVGLDPKIASLAGAEFKKVLLTARSPAAQPFIELIKHLNPQTLASRGETGKAVWLEPAASLGTQTIGEMKLTVQGKPVTCSIHADTHVWGIIDLIQRLEKGEPLALVEKGKGDASMMKLGTLREGKPEVVKNLQIYCR